MSLMSGERYFTQDTKAQDISQRSARGGIFTAAAQIFNTVLMLMSTVVMARWLTPEDYGIVVFATVFTGFAQLFTNAGFELPTIQSKVLHPQKVSNLFWLSFGVGLLVAGVTAAFSPLVAKLLDDQRQIAIIFSLVPIFIFAAATSQHRALMIRAFHNLQLSIIDVIANLTGACLGMLLAIVYQSYWALIAMLVSVVVTRAVLIFSYVRWLPSMPKKVSESAQEAAFGANVTFYNVINYVSRSADNFLIGWQWGYDELGAYDRAYKILLAPIRQLNGPLTNITLAALSRLLDKPDEYRRAYLTVLKLLLALSMPLSAFAVMHKELVIGLLLGPQWEMVIPIFGWLGLAGLGQSVYSSLGWLYISQARSKQYIKWGFINVAAHLGAFAIGIQWGALGIAISYCIVFYTVLIPAGFYMAGREGPVSTKDLFSSLIEPALLSAAIVVTTGIAALFLITLAPLLQLTLLGLISCAVFAGYVLVNLTFFKKLKTIVQR